MIPEGWELRRLQESGIAVIDGDRGKAYPSSDDFFHEGYCLFLSAKNVTKAGFVFDDCQFVTEAKHKQLRKGSVQPGDLVLTTRGTVGNIGYLRDLNGFGAVRINSGMVVVRNSQKFIDTDFLHTLFRSPVIEKQIERLNFGSAQPQLTVKIINSLKLPIPPDGERQWITSALETWTRAIETVEALIANARTQKQALMQQLLTGKRRLPGFAEDGRIVSLSEIAKIETGSSNKEDSLDEGEYTFFDRSTEIRRSDQYLFDTEAIIIGGEGQEFIPKHFHGKFDLHQRAYALHSFKDAECRFVFYATHHVRHLLRRYSVGSTVASLRMPTFERVKIWLPPVPEQKAISARLTAIDAEILGLQSQLTALRQEKAALMQQLLTGKRRVKLPESEVA